MVFLPLFLNSIIPSSAIFKRNADGFTTTTAATTTTTAVTNAAFSTPLAAAFSVVLFILCGFLYGYGAAKLSWNYNIYVGNTTGAAFFNSILAYIFSSFYYPFYSIVLSPIGGAAV
jgi:hypothetical protein